MVVRDSRQRIIVSSISLLIIFLIGIIAWYALKPVYQTFFIYSSQSVSGLQTSAPVEFKGVVVGTVNHTELINHDWVKIQLNIDKNFQVKKNTIASISTRGLTNRGYTGYVFIELSDTNKQIELVVPPNVNKRLVIPLTAASSYGLDKTLKEMNSELKQIAKLINFAFDKKTIINFKRLLTNAQMLTYHLEKHDKDLINLLVNMEGVSNDIRPVFKTGRGLMLTLDQEFLPEASETLIKINSLSDSLLDLTSKLNKDPSIIVRGIKPLTPGPGEGRS